MAKDLLDSAVGASAWSVNENVAVTVERPECRHG